MSISIKEGKYIYCIIELGEAKSFGPLGIGGRGDELYAICFGGIAAVVSNSPIIKYSISRENTITHERAIEEVMKEHVVLPVRFATIAEDEEKVKEILEKEYGKFKGLLHMFEDKKELGVRAMFKESVYKYILARYEDIKILKETIVGLPADKTHFQCMKIGEMVEKALEEEKESYKEKILSALTPLAEDIRTKDTYGAEIILNVAFLVNKNKEAEFDKKIQQIDANYGNIIKFKYVGLVPPFNFVNLVIETGRY